MSDGNGGLLFPPTNGPDTHQSAGAGSRRVGESASYGSDELRARVWYRQHEATLTYDKRRERISLQRVDRRGSVVDVIKVSTWNVVNVETSEERDLRQSQHGKLDMAWGTMSAVSRRRSLRSFFKHSPRRPEKMCPRIGTISMSSSINVESHYSWASGLTSLVMERSMSGTMHPAGCYGCLYYLYYIKDSGSSVQVSTLKFSPLPDYENQQKVGFLVQSILRSVYPRGAKKLILFVSPKSGSGNAVNITENKVLPVLYFTRHEVRAIVTNRVFHCEDYIANVENYISDRHVIVCVGGDGMIHEAVNGLFRRRHALLRGETVNLTEKVFTRHGEKEKEEGGGAHQKEDQQAKGGNITENNRFSLQAKNGRINEGRAAELRDTIDVGELENGGNDPAEPLSRPLDFDAVSRPYSSLDGMPFSPPLIATIPAGSGCGMAKTLDIASLKESILALVHLQTCVKDLMSMQYIQDSEYEPSAASFPHLCLQCLGGKEGAGDSSGEKKERVISERIAFMSVTFGLLNVIDRGSEKLRWMGKGRFTAYGAYIFLKGVRSYCARVRYLPWWGREGQQLEKLEEEGFIPDESEIPRCTWKNACSHCQANDHQTRTHTALSGLDGCPLPPPGTMGTEPPRTSKCEPVDFDDDSLPWVTLDGKHYAIFLSNIRDAAKDIMMTPLAHMSDGAIDMVFSREKGAGNSRSRFLKFFTGMETGNHVKLPFVSYIKARAVELEAVEGFIMSDGEVMPFTKVRITPMRRAVELVRGR